jgi:Cellulase (glycosyl hydrolase family 5)
VRRSKQGQSVGSWRGIALTMLLLPVCLLPTRLAAAGAKDALHSRVLTELSSFTGWLKRNGVKGYIGEVGWPNDPEDADKWNALAQAWFEGADEARLWVTTWATGEWWGADYRLSPYVDADKTGGVNTRRAQASVIEAHRTSGRVLRGINVAGGEFAAPSNNPYSSFSNANPGVYGIDYHYDTRPTFDYLASVGIGVVRIPFRWERVQPRLGHALDEAELQRMKDVVARANAAGLDVILDMHNYGAYYISDGSRGLRRPIGSAEVPIERFAEVWGRLARHFQDNRGVIGYGLMNEPIGLAAVVELSPAEVWEMASQAALNRIRFRGDKTTVLVSGYLWSGVRSWTQQHPDAWIKDNLGKFRYEAHHYWDRDNSGGYGHSYDEEVVEAR